MLPADDEAAFWRSRELFAADPRVHQLWDPGREVAGALGPPLLGPDGGPAWDVYLFFGPEARWTGTAPPRPAAWFHQLGRRRVPGHARSGDALARSLGEAALPWLAAARGEPALEVLRRSFQRNLGRVRVLVAAGGGDSAGGERLAAAALAARTRLDDPRLVVQFVPDARAAAALATAAGQEDAGGHLLLVHGATATWANEPPAPAFFQHDGTVPDLPEVLAADAVTLTEVLREELRRATRVSVAVLRIEGMQKSASGAT